MDTFSFNVSQLLIILLNLISIGGLIYAWIAGITKLRVQVENHEKIISLITTIGLEKLLAKGEALRQSPPHLTDGAKTSLPLNIKYRIEAIASQVVSGYYRKKKLVYIILDDSVLVTYITQQAITNGLGEPVMRLHLYLEEQVKLLNNKEPS